MNFVGQSSVILQSASVPLQGAPGLFASPLGKLLVALVVVALVLLVGRFVLHVTWRLLKIAIVLVAVGWIVSVVVPGVGL